jgi:hypothetical protein
MIAGLTIGGGGAKTLLLRAAGPTIGAPPYNVSGVLADPKLTLTTPAGALLASNDDWDTGDQRAVLEAAFTQTGAFPLTPGGRESALLVSLPAGSYTAIVEGASGGTGVAIVEVYDVDPASAARLINLSTRGYAGGGDSVMIMGFVVEGSAAQNLLVRGVGPRIGAAPYNVPGVLADPQIDLTTQAGAFLNGNDDWGAMPSDAVFLSGVFTATGAFPLGGGSRDAALFRACPVGGYTAIVSGADGGSGIALGELYVVP